MNDAAARPLGRPKTVTPSPVRFTTRLAPRGYLRLRLRIYAITSSESVPESIRFRIRLWLERRNTFRESAVVDGRLAMSSNLGPAAVFGDIVGLIS